MKTAGIRPRLQAFVENEEGVTAIEYALLAALIFGAIVISVGVLGEAVAALYDDVAAKVAAALS
ncbi:Flp family type IVb pilin [Thauera chlorobenzoica]|uniref:Flp pilus assembly protein, pilin Flp n=1 Tax=Thauera chlorobenzoica TaxID=96773 RepID=A0A1H5XTL9_9RHOO|nr:Flp family type IVb pilin [Thauera chlorobenzoica]APR04574.1 Flp pilus assembly protein, pilin Flp [Thauera chlorobenzoica]SEG14875.1 pilus assembly protein Flp/PilA [Thauera chlorobenzoica]